MTARSPWERALGDQLDELGPALRRYFGAIPPGSVGRAIGEFDAVGTPRRWLWPVLAILARDSVVFPVWQKNVPFTVENRSTPRGTIRARRSFHFASGERTMLDETGITRAGLTDRLGRRATVVAGLDATVVDGRLELRSTRATLRIAGARIPLGFLSPRLTLVESTVGEGQHVSLRLDAPIIGLIYEYAGSFTYAIEAEESSVA